MKSMFKIIVSGALAAVMLVSAAPVFADGSAAEGESGQRLRPLRTKSLEISEDLVLESGRYLDNESGHFLAENYYVYTPGGDILPDIAFGNDICGAASYARAMRIEDERGLNILGGANADYFTFATGTSLGPVVKDGTVCTSEHSSFEEIGFFEDGSALMGRMGLNVEFTELVTGQVYPLMAFNKDLERGGGLVLYSNVFGDTNNASGEGLNVLIRIDEGEARIGETIKGTIESVFDSDGPVALDEGHLLLSVYKDTKYLTVIPILLAMKEGDGVTVSFSSDPQWQDVYHVVGGAERLIKDGELCSVEAGSRAPRTAIGVTEEGKIILYTADGRNASHSMGLTLTDLAQRLADLGCVDAVNLDGGGSTQLHCVLPGYAEDSLINKPSEDRRCANYIMFAVPKEEPSEASEIFVYPYGEYILAGSSMGFQAKAIDGGYNPVELSEEPVFSSKIGGFEGNVFTADPDAEGEGRVRASADGIRGSAYVTVVQAPDSVLIYENGRQVNDTVISVKEGDERKFTAGAVFDLLPIIADSEAFVWEVSEGMGVIEADGTYKAEGVTSEEGTVTVTCAGVTASFSLTSDLTPPVIEAGAEGPVASAVISDNKDGHPAGSGIRVTVDGKSCSTFGYARAEGRLVLDFSGEEPGLHHVLIKVSDAAGNRTRAELSVWVDEPEEDPQDPPTEEPSAQDPAVSQPQDGVQPSQEPSDGPSEEPPAPISFSDMEGHWASDYAHYLAKHGIFQGRGSAEAPVFAPDSAMTRQEFATVLIRWLGMDTAAYEETELPYTDLDLIADYALPAVKTAYALGIIEGKSRLEERFFDPKGTITRQEVMTVIGRTLEEGLGKADISGFPDASDVAGWALPYVQTLVCQGVIDGSGGRINPLKGMTRAEAAAVIYRCY